MKTAGVEHLAGRTMAEISDGQRQKVMIAKALAQDTDVILLDEPLSFLDMPAKVEIMNILKNLAQAEGQIARAFHPRHRPRAAFRRQPVGDAQRRRGTPGKSSLGRQKRHRR